MTTAHAPEGPKQDILLALSFVAVVCILDIVTTIYASQTTHGIELNPIGAWLLNYGVFGFALGLVPLKASEVGLLAWIPKLKGGHRAFRPIFLAIFSINAFVVIINTISIVRFAA